MSDEIPTRDELRVIYTYTKVLLDFYSGGVDSRVMDRAMRRLAPIMDGPALQSQPRGWPEVDRWRLGRAVLAMKGLFDAHKQANPMVGEFRRVAINLIPLIDEVASKKTPGADDWHTNKGMVTVKEASEKVGLDKTTVTRRAKEHLIPGAFQDDAGEWQIPKDWVDSQPPKAPEPREAPAPKAPVKHECKVCDGEFMGIAPRPKCPKCGSNSTFRKNI
jgi:hypothetical protein